MELAREHGLLHALRACRHRRVIVVVIQLPQVSTRLAQEVEIGEQRTHPFRHTAFSLESAGEACDKVISSLWSPHHRQG
jgi:hypothetical protein